MWESGDNMMPNPDRPLDNAAEMHRYKQVLQVLKHWFPKATFTFADDRIRLRSEQFSLNDDFLDSMERNAHARIAQIAMSDRHPEYGLLIDFIVMENFK